MSGLGRGSMLDRLKLQKQAAQREEEPRVEEIITPPVDAANAAAADATPPAGAGAEKQQPSKVPSPTEGMPRSIGRGGGLLGMRRGLGEQQKPALTEQAPASPVLRRRTEVQEQAPPQPQPTVVATETRVTPSPPQVEVSQPTIVATEARGSVQTTTSTLISKGRGFAAIKKVTTATSEVTTQEAAATLPRKVSPTGPPPPTFGPQRTSPVSLPKTPPESIPTIENIQRLQAETTAAATASTATTTTTTTPPQSKQSQAASSTKQTKSDTSTTMRSQQSGSGISHKTMEKAMEEIRIEEIKRTSPVQKFGSSGVAVDLSANYIKLKCKNAGVYQYVVQYNPPCESRSNRMRMIQSLRDTIGNVRLFDGMTLFLPIMLRDQPTYLTAKRPTDNVETTVKIQLTKILPPEQIPPVVFNIIFRSIMNELKMKQIGQHFYNPQQHIPVHQHRLDIWPGYITAVHEFADGLYLVADVSHKVIRSETCWQILNDLRKRGSPNLKEEATSLLVGSVVLTPYNNHTYRIDDILWDLTPESTFMYHDKQEWTYVQYYKQHYGITIDDVGQPLLLNRAKRSKKEGNGAGGASEKPQEQEIVCLIPELCCMTGLTDEIKKDFRIMRELANHTRVTPTQRYESLRAFVENIRAAPNALKHLTNWGLELDDDTVNFSGRTLPRETITVGRGESFQTTEQCDWNRETGRKQVLRAVDLNNWMIVFTRRDAKTAERFADSMNQCSKQMGIRITDPTVVELNDDRTDTYIKEIKRTIDEHVQMVVIIFPTSRDDRYAAVKRLCCIEHPVPSQCIIAKTILEEKTLRSVTQKILLQMNCKLGGELWRLSIPIQKLMVIGIDVYHQTEKRYKSIAGFVSSLNVDQTRWYSKICFQMVGQELVDSLKIALKNALQQYRDVNNFLPDKIIIFRDGVSDGQLNYVSEHEVQQLRTCFDENYSPKLGVVIVQKRINARIFGAMGTHNHERQFKNPDSGTIVDHTITRKELYDYFLVSQHVRQGTVTPTHYIVVYDDTQFQPDHMQRLSYKLTHLYYNWPGTVRVPAPCQYAHKLAYLTGQHLQKEPNAVLCNRLFYL